MIPSTPSAISRSISARSFTVHGMTLSPSAFAAAIAAGARSRKCGDQVAHRAAEIADVEPRRPGRRTGLAGALRTIVTIDCDTDPFDLGGDPPNDQQRAPVE